MGTLNETTAELQSNLNWYISKTEGTGIKVDLATPTFPWVDLIGLVQPDVTSPGTTPDMVEFRTGIKAYQFDTNDLLHCIFHIPHDWLPDSDAEFHLHLGFNVDNTAAQACSFTPTVSYGSRDGTFGAPVTLATIDHTSAGADQYTHPVIEVPLCRVNGTANTLDKADIEVDGLLLISVALTSEDLTGNPFVFTADIHHQSTGIGTKNNASPFYT